MEIKKRYLWSYKKQILSKYPEEKIKIEIFNNFSRNYNSIYLLSDKTIYFKGENFQKGMGYDHIRFLSAHMIEDWKYIDDSGQHFFFLKVNKTLYEEGQDLRRPDSYMGDNINYWWPWDVPFELTSFKFRKELIDFDPNSNAKFFPIYCEKAADVIKVKKYLDKIKKHIWD